MLSIQLSGPPKILRDGQQIEQTRRKSRALLYYIAARTTPVTREHALALFWPEAERAAAQQTLRTTLHGLRKSLGDALQASDDQLVLLPDVQVDTRLFEQHLLHATTPAQHAAALAHYHGDFLEDFALPDSEDFERWMFAERERLRQLALGGLLKLAHGYEAERQFGPALAALAQAQALDPLHEEVQRVQMRVQYFSGDRAGAIRRYERLRDRLDDELGVPPLAETRALYDAIITDTLAEQAPKPAPEPAPAPAPPVTRPALFVGRDLELRMLDAATRIGRLVLLEGEPGIGKTSTVEAWLAETPGLVLRGAAYELEWTLPYQPIIEALRAMFQQGTQMESLNLAPVWRAELGRLLPELGAAPPAQLPVDEARLWESVHQLLLALAPRQPVTLFLDDLHWADQATLGLLGYLVRQQRSASVRYVATARPAAPRSGLAVLLHTLTRAQRIERVTLHRFSLAETYELAQRNATKGSEALGEWLTQHGEGSPYIIAELVRYARERGWLRADGTVDAAALSTSPIVTQGTYSLIGARLAALSPEARRLLDIAVAVGREFDFQLVARAAELPEAALLDAADELRSSGFIHPTEGQRFAFDHSMTIEVAYREIGEPRHRVLHRDVALALAESPYDDATAGLIASHFAEGGEATRAVPFAWQAGRRAMRLAAWQEAIRFFELVVQGTPPAQQAEALLALGEARSRAGENRLASTALAQAAELADQQSQQQVARQARLALAPTLLSQGRFAEAIAAAQPLLATSEQASAEFIWGAALSIEGSDLEAASYHLSMSERLLAVQPATTSTVNLARVKFELGGIAAQQGNLIHAVELYREVIMISACAQYEETPLMVWRILAHNNLAYHLHLMGDPTALSYAQSGLRLTEEHGYPGLQPYFYSTMGEIALAEGDLDAAEHLFRQGLASAEQVNLVERVAGITANQGLVAIQRGQTEHAISLLSSALARADKLGTRHLAAQIRIWLAPLLPQPHTARLLAEARTLAESGHRQRLLDAISALEKHPQIA